MLFPAGKNTWCQCQCHVLDVIVQDRFEIFGDVKIHSDFKLPLSLYNIHTYIRTLFLFYIHLLGQFWNIVCRVVRSSPDLE